MLVREKFVAVKNGGLPITTALLDRLSGKLLDFGATAIVLKLGIMGCTCGPVLTLASSS